MTYPYISFTDASIKLQVSLKTIYNYITKSNGVIRTNKALGKSFVNFEDLQSYITNNYKILQNDLTKLTKSQEIHEQENKSKNSSELFSEIKYQVKDSLQNDILQSYKNLQNDYKIKDEKIEQLEKFNSNLQDQTNKYAIKLNEEKEEKKLLQEKYDVLEGEYRSKIEEYAEYRVATVKNRTYYIVLIVITFLCLLLLIYLYQHQLYIF